ncbi:unnamed protein product [Arabis nemorensis]|uniref:Uncharacterized protein n=1 Tax=Arabis nemorensis TaxID=586526 RepID=A0A565BHA2_9BRAS|nr:unnamed protein product [Arabis nemorensis]
MHATSLSFYVGWHKMKRFGQGKRRMSARTSMAHREDVICRVVYNQQVTDEQHPGLFVTCGQIEKLLLRLSNVKCSSFTSSQKEYGLFKNGVDVLLGTHVMSNLLAKLEKHLQKDHCEAIKD